MNKKGTKIWTALTLLLILVVLPLGSWYYLHSGFSYYKTALSELKDYGKLSAFSLTNQKGEVFDNESVAGKVFVANFMFTRCPTICPKMTEQMKKLHHVFHKNKEIALLSHTVDPEHDSVEVLQQYIAAHQIPDDGVWHFLTGDKQQIHQLARKAYQLPADEGANSDDFIHSQYFVLVDSKGVIRNYYDGTDTTQVNRLMEHIALIIPKKKKDEATRKQINEL